MHHLDERSNRNDRSHRERGRSPPRRNRNSTGSGTNDRRQHDHYNNQNSNNNNARLPPKPPHFAQGQPMSLPAPVAAFNYGQPMALPAPTSTGFLATNASTAVPAFHGGAPQQQDWLQQMMQMGVGTGQSMNGFTGLQGGYGQR